MTVNADKMDSLDPMLKLDSNRLPATSALIARQVSWFLRDFD